MSVKDSAEDLGRADHQPTGTNGGLSHRRHAQVAARTDTRGATMKPLTPAWNWEALTVGSAPWRAAWEDFGTWVQWYTERYELWQSMPVCWYLHSRLVEELRALRFYHEEVIGRRAARGEVHASRADTCARAHWDWMIARREWERVVLGHVPGEHGGCSGLSHDARGVGTVAGHADRLRRMSGGLAAMLDTTVLGH